MKKGVVALLAVLVLSTAAANAASCEATCKKADGTTSTISCSGDSCFANDNQNVECTSRESCGTNCWTTKTTTKTCSGSGGTEDPQVKEQM